MLAGFRERSLRRAQPVEVPPPDGGAQAWLRVFAYILCCLGSLGLQYGFGTLYVSLLDALGEGPAATALVGSLCAGGMDGFAFISGKTIEHFGSRQTCLLGMLLSVIGLASSAAATRTWHLYLSYGLVCGLGQSLAFFSPIVMMTRWFSTKLARAHAVANLGGALTPLVLGPVLPRAIAAIGWRNVLLCLAGADALLLGSAALLLTPPREITKETTSTVTVTKPADEPAAEPPAPPTLWSVLRLGRVQRLCVITFLFGTGGWVGVVHVVRLGMERCGWSEAEASEALLVLLAVGSCTCRIPVAWLADRCGRKIVWASVCAVHAALNFMAASTADFASDESFIRVFAFCIGGLLGAMNSTLATVPTELELPRPLARICVPVIITPMGIGMLTGPWVAGAIRQSAGRYSEAFVFAGASLAAASGLMLLSLGAQRALPKESPLARLIRI